MRSLTRDPKFNVWSDPARQIDYSDGEVAEANLLDSIQQCQDRSLFSEELHARINDWPSEYHLVWERSNVLRPVPIAKGARVLEIGAGCGAITRYLGEIGAQVTAVEGGLPRARCSGVRCGDLPNVKVCAADFNRLDFGGDKFDLVTLIGVFEYTAKYSAEPQPYRRMLERCRGLLGAEGRLVIAIENQLGLKYLLGFEEDHLGTAHSGVTDLYDARGVRTFGREELARMLGEAGFPHVEFLYPFPDYKLPRVIVSDQGLEDGEFDAAQLLHGVHSRNYSGKPAPEASEALSARALARNGVMGDLANSFLVVASARQRQEAGPLAWAFSNERKTRYAVETTFVRPGAKAPIEVRKARMQPATKPDSDAPVEQEVHAQAKYFAGENVAGMLDRLRARGDQPAYTALLADWARAAKRAVEAAQRDGTLPALYDALPRNWIRAADGSMSLIDLEWRVPSPVTARSIVIRYGLVEHAALSKRGESRADSLPLVDRLLAAIGEPPVKPDEWERLDGEMRRIGEHVYLSALRLWRYEASKPKVEAGGPKGKRLPWSGDSLLDFGSVRVELCLPPEVFGRESSDGNFFLGKNRFMVEKLFERIGSRDVRRALTVGVMKGGEVVLLNEHFRPSKLVGIEAGRGDIPALNRYISAQLKGSVRWHRGTKAQGIGGLVAEEFIGGDIDLVIDNGSHLYSDTRATFDAVFPQMRYGGLYVIESWAWAHWPGEFWQKQRGGDFFRNQQPLTNLVVELLLASAGAPALISKVEIDANTVCVERGYGAVEGRFSLTDLCHNRGEPLPRFGRG